ncbi:MAG: pirin family protein [Alphaproteobacteria bacterium]|nr:pirin family protein [Alphaproteobacteria bacterium]
MIALRKSSERGITKLDWLDGKHSFSFGRYYDPAHMGFGPLRVINEDRVAPGGGFATHPHDNMEIVTYVLEGALQHKDSMGNGAVIRPGDIQRMSAGTGVTHSEFNASKADPVHLLQIWFLPEKRGISPSYEQRSVPAAEKIGTLKLVIAPDGRDGTVKIHQDIKMYVGLLDGQDATFTPDPGRLQWLQVARGSVNLNDQALEQGDGAAIRDEKVLRITNAKGAEVVLFDMVV